MPPLAVAIAVLLCVLSSIFAGAALRRRLPAQHFSDESKFVVELSIGLIAAMSALVLGLLTASTNRTFEEQEDAVKVMTAKVLELDYYLRRYGAETAPVRKLLTTGVEQNVKAIWNAEAVGGIPAIAHSTPVADNVGGALRALNPQTDAQKEIVSKVIELLEEGMKTRWLALVSSETPIPPLFLVVLIFWLSLLFLSFGMFAARNVTVFSLLSLSGVSVAAAIFVILELGTPYSGLIQVSSKPLLDVIPLLAPQ